MENRLFLLIVGIGIVVLLGWILFAPAGVWRIRADTPRAIGGYGDHFAYDGGATHRLEGTLDLHFNRSLASGILSVSLRTTEASGPLAISSNESLEGKIRLVSQLDRSARIEEGIPAYGDTGTGGTELPQTHAALAGWSRFDLFVGEDLLYSGLQGEWALIDALRRNDGAIRQSGLIYSPLLRDKTGFSDPQRKEFILIVHSDDSDPENKPPFAVVLHLVFGEVEIERSPRTE